MTKQLFLSALMACGFFTCAMAQEHDGAENDKECCENSEEQPKSRFTVGGYGEAVMSRNFYSQNVFRYTYPDRYKNGSSHGRFDLPHIALNMGYNFGKGWSMGLEVEFEHGGTESAVEMDADESGEYEAEVERGGEVAIEQFWVNKAFWKGKFNVKAGEIIIPVGEINAYHMPMNFFSVYRSEGEAKMLPNTWHQVGISLWGRTKDWRYEAIFTSGLDAERFGNNCYAHYGAGSPYEYKLGNVYAGAARVDNYSVRGLRLSLSGYYGYTFRNTNDTPGDSYSNVTGALSIGSFGFELNRWNWIVRGNATYSHLDNASRMTTFFGSYPKHNIQDGSPSKRTPIAKNAYSVGIEAGYNVFSQINSLRNKQKLYVFGRYENYDTYASGNAKAAQLYNHVQRLAFGVNYLPIKQVVVKAEWGKRFFESGYNNEPSLNLGVAFEGMFDINTKKKCRHDAGMNQEQMERINKLVKEVEMLKHQQKMILDKQN